MKIALSHLVALLFLTIHASAQENCQSAWIYNEYFGCAKPAHGTIFRNAPNKACGVQSYKSCKENYEVTASYFRKGEFVEWKPNDQAASINCANHVQATPSDMDKIYQQAAQIAKDRGYYKKQSLDAVIGLLKSVNYSWEASGRITGGRADVNRYECTFKATFKVSETFKDKRCGVWAYNSCETKENGIQGYVIKKSSLCSVNYEKFALVPEAFPRYQKEFFKDRGQFRCPLAVSMPESNVEEITARINALDANLNYLNTADPMLDDAEITQAFRYLSTLSSDTQSNLYLVEIQMILEKYRLNELLATKGFEDMPLPADDDKRSELEPLFQKAFKDPSPAHYLVPISLYFYVDVGAQSVLESLKSLYPEVFAERADLYRDDFLDMKPLEYIVLFPEAIRLTEKEMLDVEQQIKDQTDSEKVYRLAEAAVRTGLADIQEQQKKSLKLMDLRVRLFRQNLNYEKLAEDLAAISGNSVETAKAKLAQYKNDNLQLQQAATAIINSMIKIINRKVASKKTALWNLVALAKVHSTSPSLPILDGYKALSEFDASALTSAVKAANLGVKDAKSVVAIKHSLLSLVKSSRDNLAALDAIRTMLSQTVIQHNSIEESVIGKIADVSGSSDVGGQLVVPMYEFLEEFDGGPGAEIGLQDEILSLVEDIYNQFEHALQQLPELGE